MIGTSNKVLQSMSPARVEISAVKIFIIVHYTRVSRKIRISPSHMPIANPALVQEKRGAIKDASQGYPKRGIASRSFLLTHPAKVDIIIY
jgi:hypothetical protein